MLSALAAAAFIAGLAGAWSPCGFSMVDTLAPQGYAQRMRVTVVACLTFAVGALAGGVATFGGLALLGEALGTGRGVLVAIACALLLAAAAGDAAGRRIVPQVRRQVPEAWRRVLPVPLAAGLYGVLLGLGFTTFVLSFAVYGLAAACLALGEPAIGLAVGVAFAAGRIVPVVLLAPLQETERGIDLAAAMEERPAVLRAIRGAGAVALSAAGLALALGGAPASAAAGTVITDDGTDPSAVAGEVAWQRPGGGPGVLARAGGALTALPGTDPALSPDGIVWREGDTLVVADRATLAERLRIAAPGADEPALSANWLVWRAREAGGEVLRAVDLRASGQPAVDLRRATAPARLGRPSVSGDRVVYHVATRRSSRIEEIYLPSRRRTSLRKATKGAQLLNPSEHGNSLLWVRSTAERQQVLIGPRRARRGGRDSSLLTAKPTIRRDLGREPGRHRHAAGYPGGRAPSFPSRPPEGVTTTLWSTALAPDGAYVSRMRRTREGTSTVIVRLSR